MSWGEASMASALTTCEPDFWDCSGLTSVELWRGPTSLKALTTRKLNFYDCSGLLSDSRRRHSGKSSARGRIARGGVVAWGIC